MDDRIQNYYTDTINSAYKPGPQATYFEGIPTGIELDNQWRPITSSDSFRVRQACCGLAACLLILTFFAGVYLFYAHFTKLGYFESMRFWVIGLVVPPFCTWAMFKQAIFSVEYASPRGVFGIVLTLMIAGFAFILYHLGLPAVGGLFWEIVICLPGYLIIPALMADVFINIPNRVCIEWRKQSER